MKKILFIIFTCCVFSCCCFAQQPTRHMPVIFDSDMGADYDDVGAITMLHAFADSGYINILATVASTSYKDVAGVFDVLNTYFNRPNLPIGVAKKNGLALRDWQHWPDTLLANYPHDIRSNEEVPEAVDVYRKALAAAQDQSVTIITVGFLTNLANLLQSGPDQYSSLSGTELVKQKVKRLVSMAGKFPVGKEFNVEKDAASSQYVFLHWPTQVLLSGFEIGQKIKVGLPLTKNDNIRRSPVKDVFRICIPKAKEDSAGRMSWDETAVLVAVKGYQPYYNIESGTMIVAADGSNTWTTAGSMHAHLVEKVSPDNVAAYIEKLISHQPVKLSKQ